MKGKQISRLLRPEARFSPSIFVFQGYLFFQRASGARVLLCSILRSFDSRKTLSTSADQCITLGRTAQPKLRSWKQRNKKSNLLRKPDERYAEEEERDFDHFVSDKRNR